MFRIVRTTALVAIASAAVISAGTASAQPAPVSNEARTHFSSASTSRCHHVVGVKTANGRTYVTRYGAACLEA